MKYSSTRGQTAPHSFSEAVRVGLAPDGGLFVPESFPDLSQSIPTWESMSYAEVCFEFFRNFATDIPEAELKEIVDRSYRDFDHVECAPIREIEDGLYLQELFHGPTLAFKDFALQLLGNLYERQVRETGKEINVLGATSGDTGAAAISGLLGKEGVNIFILYPNGRVSALQERQMTCTGESNVFPLSIEGSFDDAQAALKEVFSDREFSGSVGLSAVNSINTARVLAQCVYYIFAWLRLPASIREKTTFVVPSGNFGNVIAGWMASNVGMKVAGFRVATNQNDILHRFFTTGDYSLEGVSPSLAPSMDIQIASNFERFLYFALGSDATKTREMMESFKEARSLRIEDSAILGMMSSSRTDDARIREIIASVYERFGLVIDPHTACGFEDLDSLESKVVLSTAHPAKFPDVIAETIGVDSTHPILEALKGREVVTYPLAPNAAAIKEFILSKQR